MKESNLIGILDFIDNLADNFTQMQDSQKPFALICMVYAEGILDKGRGFVNPEQKSLVTQRLDISRDKIMNVVKTFDPEQAKALLQGAGQSFENWVK